MKWKMKIRLSERKCRITLAKPRKNVSFMFLAEHQRFLNTRERVTEQSTEIAALQILPDRRIKAAAFAALPYSRFVERD